MIRFRSNLQILKASTMKHDVVVGLLGLFAFDISVPDPMIKWLPNDRLVCLRAPGSDRAIYFEQVGRGND